MTIEVPEGYEVDEANTTATCIKFKKVEPEDDIAIKKGVFNSCYDSNLEEFCQKAFDSRHVIQVGTSGVHDSQSELRHRCLYVGSSIDVTIKPSHVGGHLLIFRRKK